MKGWISPTSAPISTISGGLGRAARRLATPSSCRLSSPPGGCEVVRAATGARCRLARRCARRRRRTALAQPSKYRQRVQAGGAGVEGSTCAGRRARPAAVAGRASPKPSSPCHGLPEAQDVRAAWLIRTWNVLRARRPEKCTVQTRQASWERTTWKSSTGFSRSAISRPTKLSSQCPRRPDVVARGAVPGGRRDHLVVRDPAVADLHPVPQAAAGGVDRRRSRPRPRAARTATKVGSSRWARSSRTRLPHRLAASPPGGGAA